MNKLWAGRFSKQEDERVNDFNSSIAFDARMAQHDIQGSIAHATMLGRQGIIEPAEAELIVQGLEGIARDLQTGALAIDPTAEDIHMFVEAELTSRLGDTGKRLHTARSRNDQVALDIRLYLRDQCQEIHALLLSYLDALTDQAAQHLESVMPGYTHLQRAQPITFAHHLMAYAQMALRDLQRLEQTQTRMNIMPLGSIANLKHVRCSNFCDISLHLDPRTHRLIVVSAIDNMVKGAAGQAIQNMNLVCGFPETAGLALVPPAF